MGCTPSTEKRGQAGQGKCPQGHGLKIKRSDDAAKYCGQCKNSIFSEYMVCDPCGYVSCKSCANSA